MFMFERIGILVLLLVVTSESFTNFNPVSSNHASTTSKVILNVKSNKNEKSDQKENETKWNTKQGKGYFPSRRNALAATASAMLSASTLVSVPRSFSEANALSLPFEKSTEVASGYKQAKRATSYLVDSTIPPTLVPFRAAREAAILKEIGSGKGTQKTVFVEESINLNNFMKKSVYGTIDAISSVVNPSEELKKGPTFCFLALPNFHDGANEDVELAESIMVDLFKPRQSQLKTNTALGLALIPKLSGQSILDQYLADGNEESLISNMESKAQVKAQTISYLLPILKFARQKGVAILALGPEKADLKTVRADGLQDLDIGRRSEYVLDTQGFINLTQDPKFKLYADRSLLKDWEPLPVVESDNNKKQDGPGDFFAERILEDETIATSMAQWAVLRPESFMVVISDISHTRYLGGANGRIPRIMKYLNEASVVDEENVSSILINPTAENTLSQSRFLRLEIGTSPDNVTYQTKIADYLWFTRIPKVNMLPRLMRGN